MLDQLVESRSTAGENTRRGGFLLTTGILLASALVGAWMYSLFAHDYAMGSGDLELSSLVAPVPVPEEAPPPPEPEQKPEKQQTTDSKPVDMAMRTTNTARVDEPFPPKDVSSAPASVKARPQGSFQIGNKDVDVTGSPGPARDTSGSGGGGGIVPSKPQVVESSEDEPPKPPPAATPKPTPPPVPKKVSLGVLNGKATRLVQPPYPPAAKAVRASGTVNVQISIDPAGNVVSASAVSGHPLLRQAAENAARQSKFSPTMLSGQAVSVSGVIVYNFQAQ
jgi:TonB family protein